MAERRKWRPCGLEFNEVQAWCLNDEQWVRLVWTPAHEHRILALLVTTRQWDVAHEVAAALLEISAVLFLLTTVTFCQALLIRLLILEYTVQ